MRKVLPILKNNQGYEIEDGSVIEASFHCKRKCNNGSCLKFYQELQYAETGFYVCPNGLSVYVFKSNGLTIIYTSMRVKGHYCKRNSQNLGSDGLSAKCFSPVIGEDMFFRLKNCDMQITEQEVTIESTKSIHAELLHDIRKICAHIKNKSEDIIGLDDNIDEICNDCNMFEILQKVKNIEALASIATSRFEVYDLSMNPATMCYGKRRNRIIYQKFHKSKFMLTGYMGKDIRIIMQGQSTFDYPVYQTFDALPFILLENAVKYAPEGSEIDIIFREEYNNLYVSVVSEGPICTKDELPLLFTKGYRASAAKCTKTAGSGVGLSLAKEICDAHEIEICIISQYNRKINGIPYGKFEVNLSFFH